VSWVCPTLSRPHRLQELAKSWERCQPQTHLYVRLWAGDPLRKEYQALSWPKMFKFYDSDAKGCGEALNDFFERHPDEEFYGFIADDIVLRTRGGCELLQSLAAPFFVAYPNDCLQRWKMATHFCIGGDLVREVGWFAHPEMEHGEIDVVWYNIATHCGLLRYEPRVIFQHKHYLSGQASWDEVYSASYSQTANRPDSAMAKRDHDRLLKWFEADLKALLVKIQREVFVACEDWESWKKEDEANALVLRSPA